MTTNTPADRLAVLLREAAGGLDRQAAHELLDAALDLAEGSTEADGREGRLANAAAVTLARAVAGWTVPVERSPDEWNQLAEDDPVRWREDVATCLRVAPAAVPQPVVEALMFGVMALNDGAEAPQILACAPRPRGYGGNPASRRAIEQALHVWVALMKARGGRAGQLRKQVAKAAGVEVSAFDRWLTKWRERDGAERVDRVLAAAGALGQGQPLAEPIPDEILLLQVAPMEALAAGWKVAKAPG
jgi:hypothetical protein